MTKRERMIKAQSDAAEFSRLFIKHRGNLSKAKKEWRELYKGRSKQ